MARLSFALPILARWERPSAASVRVCRLQPGRLAQGPEEKCGIAGRTPGFDAVMWSILPDSCPSVGRGVPLTEIGQSGRGVNRLRSAGSSEPARCRFRLLLRLEL